jgi:hypothetical protein
MARVPALLSIQGSDRSNGDRRWRSKSTIGAIWWNSETVPRGSSGPAISPRPTLQWLPTTEIDIADIDDEICSHALIESLERITGASDQRQRALARLRRPALPPPGLSSSHACGEWTCPV